MRTLDELPWTDAFVSALPGARGGGVHSRQVPGAAWAEVAPSPVPAPRLLAWSDEAAALIGLARRPGDDDALAAVLGGNRVVLGMRPYALGYGGHQFGTWAGA